MDKKKIALLKRKEVKRLAYIVKIDKEIKEIRTELSANCEHPPEWVEEYRWEHDNGYGTQTWITGLRCKICSKKKPWSGSSIWVDPSRITS